MAKRTALRSCRLALALTALSCGSETPARPPQPNASPTPTPTPVPAPIPSPSAAPQCGSLPAGPVTRLAVAPREHDVDGKQAEMRVKVNEPFADEVLCIDKDRAHKIDVNLNQRNADGKECCWQDEPGWAVRDGYGVVTTQQIRDEKGFIFRVRIEPRGVSARVGLSAELDGIPSHPWQSGSGYEPGPLWIQAMSAQEIKQQCSCGYIGNGGYTGSGCPKVVN
jgi:hypothetical protein